MDFLLRAVGAVMEIFDGRCFNNFMGKTNKKLDFLDIVAATLKFDYLTRMGEKCKFCFKLYFFG
jgi:hypothetical protein